MTDAASLHPAHGVGALAEARERAFRLLTDRYADDTLTVEEFERRLDRLHAATTSAETAALVADLAAPRDAWATTHAPPPAAAPPWRPPTAAADRALVAIMGNTSRTGAWTVPARLEVRAIMSEVVLDLREARIPAEGAAIELFALMASVRILLPPEIQVEHRIDAFMTGVDDRSDAGGRDVAGVRLLVDGLAVMTGVEIRVAPRGLPTKQAWKAARRGYRALQP